MRSPSSIAAPWLLFSFTALACGSEGAGGDDASSATGGTTASGGTNSNCTGDDCRGDDGGGGEPTDCVAGTDDCEPEPPVCGADSIDGKPCPLPWIHQEGAYWVDEDGKRVNLRGTNVGNWLQLEFWMMNQNMNVGATNVNDQCTLEGALTGKFGFAEKERLMGVFRDSWITERDWDHMQALGLNVVRIPFMYSLLEDDENHFNLRADAWKYLDWAIDEAEERGMYTILDLHGAAGSQGWEHHSGCAGKNELWGSTDNRDRTKWLWAEIAKRYKDRSAVLAHGLLNEPWGTDAGTLAAFSWELFDVVRSEDPNHVIVLPGHNSGGIDSYGNPNDRPNSTNVAFEMHFYPGFWGWRENDPHITVHSEWLHCSAAGTGETCAWRDRILGLETAFLVGEFQPWTSTSWAGGQLTRKTYDIFNMYGWAGTSWAYKTVSFGGSNGNANSGWGWGMVTNSSTGGTFTSIDLEDASAEQVEAYFEGFAEQALVANPEILKWMAYEPRVGERIEAENFTSHEGVRMEITTDTDGGFNASNINPGDAMHYDVEIPESGTYQVVFRVAAQNAGGSFDFRADDDLLTTVSIPATGGWQTWVDVPATITLEAGRRRLTVQSTAGEYNVNWFELQLN